MQDPHAKLRGEVLARVLTGPGAIDPALRQAAADDRGLPAELQPFVDKIEKQAYRITDDEVARLQVIYGDDALFEIIVSAALGASRRRLLAGLRALESATTVEGA